MGIMIGDSLSSDMPGAKNASLDSVWFMPSGDVEKARKEYSIDYCAASFDEQYSVLKKWSEIPDLPGDIPGPDEIQEGENHDKG